MEEMRAKYERIALKNQEDLKAWHESQVICQCTVGMSCCIKTSFYVNLMGFLPPDHRGGGPSDWELNSSKGSHNFAVWDQEEESGTGNRTAVRTWSGKSICAGLHNWCIENFQRVTSDYGVKFRPGSINSLRPCLSIIYITVWNPIMCAHFPQCPVIKLLIIHSNLAIVRERNKWGCPLELARVDFTLMPVHKI